ncbi:hypothetical protein niasHT_027986 [Heterodera trifolii]|uniref:BAH domain-containing protein n=1 Tax=Heterodera trifolii TaxID=157864 RepID=A0ABD2KEY5_9BILA
MISAFGGDHFSAKDELKWTSIVETVRNNPLLNMQWHLCFPPSLATSSSSVEGTVQTIQEQLWHSSVGEPVYGQMFPPGFWRQLADSPPHPAGCSSASPLSSSCCSSSASPLSSSCCSSSSSSSSFCYCSVPSLPSISPSVAVHSLAAQQNDNQCQLLLRQQQQQQQQQQKSQFVLTTFSTEDSLGFHSLNRQQNLEMADDLFNDLSKFTSNLGQPCEQNEQNGQTLVPMPSPKVFTEGGDGGGAETDGDEQQERDGTKAENDDGGRRMDGDSGEREETDRETEHERQKEVPKTAEEMDLEKEGHDENLLLHALLPTPPAKHFLPQLLIQQQQTQSVAPSYEMTVASFGRMPELERQEIMGQPNAAPPADAGEEDENACPPQLDAEETMDRPILSIPKRLLEMALTAITAHSKKQKGAALCPLSAPSLPSSVCFSSSSSSSSNTSSSADDPSSNERKRRKRIATCNGQTDGGAERPLRKRRRVRSRIGPRRKQRGQRHKGRDAERHNGEGEEQQHNGTAPLRMALISVPKEAEANLVETQKKRNRKGQSIAAEHKRAGAASLLPLVSNWRPLGPGSVRRPFPDCRDTSICYDAIRHRNVPNVAIRVGDCVQINSADSEDDLFVGRVLAIHYQSEDRSLQLTLLWFYTPRQLPTAPPLSEFDPRELFASKHLDSVNVDSVNAVVHVLTFAEYCRYRAEFAFNRMSKGPSPTRPPPCPPLASNYPRRDFLPPFGTPSDAVFFCRGVFSLTKKRTLSFACAKPTKSLRGLRPKITKSCQ